MVHAFAYVRVWVLREGAEFAVPVGRMSARLFLVARSRNYASAGVDGPIRCLRSNSEAPDRALELRSPLVVHVLCESRSALLGTLLMNGSRTRSQLG